MCNFTLDMIRRANERMIAEGIEGVNRRSLASPRGLTVAVELSDGLHTQTLTWEQVREYYGKARDYVEKVQL